MLKIIQHRTVDGSCSRRRAFRVSNHGMTTSRNGQGFKQTHIYLVSESGDERVDSRWKKSTDISKTTDLELFRLAFDNLPDDMSKVQSNIAHIHFVCYHIITASVALGRGEQNN